MREQARWEFLFNYLALVISNSKLSDSNCGNHWKTGKHIDIPSNNGFSTILPAGFEIRYAASSKMHQSLRDQRARLVPAYRYDS